MLLRSLRLSGDLTGCLCTVVFEVDAMIAVSKDGGKVTSELILWGRRSCHKTPRRVRAGVEEQCQNLQTFPVPQGQIQTKGVICHPTAHSICIPILKRMLWLSSNACSFFAIQTWTILRDWLTGFFFFPRCIGSHGCVLNRFLQCLVTVGGKKVRTKI